MAVSISPIGLSTTAIVANQVSLLATYTEKLNNAYCVNSSLKPQYTVTYSYGTPTLKGGTVFVPITAVISVITPNRCDAKTLLFTESFTVAFQGQTALPTSVSISSNGNEGAGSSVRCCMASSYTINDSLIISLV